ncbi:peptidase domain-containing ABC transporter [Herbaspirillum lusitanum]|uniref:peptidase domain-containing ABC transporter n=1 Tax=Herbaspirillum lusitanum TaxID=213312 RepID=UPI002236F29E|nr:peptidase domain-containing ABC transporter [Herbaspirillum lusitanum]MCW5300172.1 peptidase domain-containing ABC transporter [Herbaspirillum lusitanum]
MKSSDLLSLALGRKLPLILQSESSECGLSCMAMIAGYHGYRNDLISLRQRFPVSLKGVSLSQLIRLAQRLQLVGRPVKLDLDGLAHLKLPCILHWNFQHYVVLSKVGSGHIVVHDPAVGIRKIPMERVSADFTGVALELWPNPEFQARDERKTVHLSDLIGRLTGLRRSVFQIVVLAIGIEIFSLAAPFYIQIVLDQGIVGADRGLLVTLAWCFALFIVLQHGIGAIRSWMILHLSTSVNIQWRIGVFSHLLNLPINFFEKRHLGDVVSRFGSVDTIQRTLTTSFLEVLMDGVMAIATLAMLFVYGASLTWIPILSAALYLTGRWLWFAPLKNTSEEQLIHGAKQHSHFLETIRGIKIIKLFERKNERRSSWLSLLINQVNANIQNDRLQIGYKLFNGWLFGLERVLIVWVAANQVLDGSLTVGVMVAFLAYREQFNSRAAVIVDKFFELKMLRLQGERLADLVLTEQEVKLDDEGAAELRLFSLELENVSFRYSRLEPHILERVNIYIKPGESVALVGKTGCGKSTLMNLMLGELVPSSGSIKLGTRPLESLGKTTYRQLIGVVMQDDLLFAGSIGENISFFAEKVDQEWVEACAEMAAIHNEIVAMPMSYHTLVGDMGNALSGGQKQRILLARALYKKPKILFLDEATSNLDVECERRVNESIKSLNITRIIVAHRPETIASAERVIYIDEGTVREA